MDPSPESKKSAFKPGIAAIWRQFKPFKKTLIFLSLFGIVSAVANGFVPYITGRFLDALINISTGETTFAEIPLWLFFLGAWAAVQLIANSVDWILDRSRRRVDTDMQLSIQANGFFHLFRLPLHFHKNERINQILERISNAGWRVTAILRNLTSIAPQFLSILIGLALAASINVYLAGILLVGVLLYVALLVRILVPVARYDEEAHKAWNEAWGDAAAAVHQIESVKQAAAEAYQSERVRVSMQDRAARLWYRLELIWSNVNFFQRIIVLLTQFTVFVFSVKFIMEGTITVGELVALNGYASMFFGPFVQLGYSWQTIQNGLTSAALVEKVFQAEPEIYHPAGGTRLSRIRGEISFDQVSFSYTPDSPVVLDGVSFSTRPGEIIALVGESGVGKSTTIQLISAYYFPTEGSVRIDGVDTRKLELASIRNHIAVVPQEVALFNDTIRENIRYGSFDASDEDVARAAREAHLEEFIERLPEKYDTVVGERGLKLSVGQKQRVSIARAILRNPSILILDEPTSALDAKTEQIITESLEKLMKGRTTFIIAHRLSTVRKADSILVFEKGKIAEEGKHAELIGREGGVYRHLYEYQIGLHQ